MYNCSNAFHTAVKNDEPQKALFIFSDAVFTNDDIDVETGLDFSDYFNLKEDLSIGQTPSNELTFHLINRNKQLNDYGFGDFLATIGVRISSSTYSQQGNVSIVTGNSTWVGYSTAPRLRRNGTQVSVQPSFSVTSMLAYDGKIWVFGDGVGQYKVYNETTAADITASNSLNLFMRNKAAGWSGRSFFYNKSTRILTIRENGYQETYEFCPLGYFTADRPNVPNKINISFECYDFMQKFDGDMPKASEMGAVYPLNIGGLFVKLCDYVGLPYKTSTFINSSATIPSEPESFENSTMRTVLGWIAEAAGSNARIDRDGYVVLDWIRSTSASYKEGDYTEFEPYWYTTKKVSKLYNRDTGEASETTVGTGSECYLIQDNPLLAGATQS